MLGAGEFGSLFAGESGAEVVALAAAAPIADDERPGLRTEIAVA